MTCNTIGCDVFCGYNQGFCLNYGTCQQYDATHVMCLCMAGYDGDRCQNVIPWNRTAFDDELSALQDAIDMRLRELELATWGQTDADLQRERALSDPLLQNWRDQLSQMASEGAKAELEPSAQARANAILDQARILAQGIRAAGSVYAGKPQEATNVMTALQAQLAAHQGALQEAVGTDWLVYNSEGAEREKARQENFYVGIA